MATLSSKARPLGVATSAQGVLADTAVQPGDSPTLADLTLTGAQHVGGAINVDGGVVTANLIGAIVATSRVSGGYGTGNSASAAVTRTSEGGSYIVTGSRHTSSTNVTNIMAQVTYSTSSRTIVTINTGTSLTVTESGGVISVNNTGTAATVYMSLTRVY
tara:strand:+ start:189 stop:668 length:480 start_codon:yes stop_codon:yes gene_type:complete